MQPLFHKDFDQLTGFRAHHIRDLEGYRARQHAETGVIAQIRTVVGAQAFHEIVAVLGLAGVMPVPLDLLVSIGMKGNWRDERVQAELQRMVKLAVEAGVPLILPVFALTFLETAT